MLLFSERVTIEVVNGETNIAVSVTNNFSLVYRLTILRTNEIVTELVILNGGQNQVQNYGQPNHTVCDVRLIFKDMHANQ